MRLCKQLSTGTPIVTPSAGDIAADTVHAASPASLARQYPRDFPDKPLRSSGARIGTATAGAHPALPLSFTAGGHSMATTSTRKPI